MSSQLTSLRSPGKKDTLAVAPEAPPCTMVIFGAAGDLTKRLVVPALYNLAVAKCLPDGFRLVGFDLADKTAGDWAASLGETMRGFVNAGGEFNPTDIDDDAWNWLTQRMSYVQGDLTDAASYVRLVAHLDALGATRGAPDSRLYYLAVADRFFGPAVEGLGAAGLTTETRGAFRRVVIEKPFGHDLASAEALNARVLGVLDESQTYRIDHFLGKETVQNILALRFGNGVFEPLWNREHIAHVQITVAETVGVEARGRFYEKTGALRDMIPNHLFQLLAMTAMEPPLSFEADQVRAKMAEVIQAVRPLSRGEALRDTVRGQYGAGTVLGRSTRAYRDEPDVAPDSTIETYVALRLEIDNWRWAGVPFYLRTGKHLAAHCWEIAIRFHRAPHAVFRGTAVDDMRANWMILRIQPDEGVAIAIAAKHPGLEMRLADVQLDFTYSQAFEMAPSTGYETLLYDAMNGDATLFKRADAIEAAWRAVQPILDAWSQNPPTDLPNYTGGSAGPETADALLARDGFAWRGLGEER